MSVDSASAEVLCLPASLGWLAPAQVNSLVRVGSDGDGGYVVPEDLLRQADVLISMGVGANWEFEKGVRALNPSILIHAYDHTVSARTFTRQYFLEIAAFLLGKVTFARVRHRRRRLIDYRRFFGAQATHFVMRIHDRPDPHSVDIAAVFERAGRGSIFVKMDIEGSEYRVLEGVLAHSDRILGLVIEFHDTGPLRPVFERSAELLLRHYEIVHVHANNFSPVYRDGLPEVLEITFARKDLIRFTKRRTELPLQEVDRPNDPRQPDYRLRFA